MKDHLFKSILKTGTLLGGLALGAVSWYTLREYRPQKVTPLPAPKDGQTLSLKDSFRLLTWNIGFAGFDKTMDFFMDGGKMVAAVSRSDFCRSGVAASTEQISMIMGIRERKIKKAVLAA